MAKSNRFNLACLVLCLVTATISSSAQTFASLVSFEGPNGIYPGAPLVQGVNGGLYGATYQGGANCGNDGCGTIFQLKPEGKLITLYSFCQQPNCTDGNFPTAGLVQATNGNFYGTTYFGGTNRNSEYCPSGCGTLFKITSAGELTTLYSFCSQPNCTDGLAPSGDLVQGINGNFYGVTFNGGGSIDCESGCGTVFEITPAGKLTTLHSFCSRHNCFDGYEPLPQLALATNGRFYGTTIGGGAYHAGTVFEITPEGKLTTIYSFCSQPNCTDGFQPTGGLVQATNGNLYGATYYGGTNCQNSGPPPGCGTVFEITPAGQLTTIYSFCSQPNCTDAPSQGVLVEATDGNFYGTTEGGGANGNYGTVFEITPAGQLTTLYSFCSELFCDDGWSTQPGLVQATNGNFYGTTYWGGYPRCSENSNNGCGTMFSLSVGLAPFVKTLPGARIVGGEVGILGGSLTEASSVAFNGTSAQFTVKSPTLILAHVPIGATTGYVTVTTPSGVLRSNVPFQVIPQHRNQPR